MTTYPYTPDYATPPGWTLEELSMSQAELARRTGLSTKHVNQIVRGKVPITTEVAGVSSAPPACPTGYGLSHYCGADSRRSGAGSSVPWGYVSSRLHPR